MSLMRSDVTTYWFENYIVMYYFGCQTTFLGASSLLLGDKTTNIYLVARIQIRKCPVFFSKNYGVKLTRKWNSRLNIYTAIAQTRLTKTICFVVVEGIYNTEINNHQDLTLQSNNYFSAITRYGRYNNIDFK